MMANRETTGAQLNRLRDRAGLSLRALAAKADYAAASSIQRYADPAFDGPLGADVAMRFADAMATPCSWRDASVLRWAMTRSSICARRTTRTASASARC